MNVDVDRFYMRRALRLAANGQGCVEPNPMVGCVVVRDDVSVEPRGDWPEDSEERALASHIVGEGWHQKFGQAHAEVNALRDAGELAKGATFYVTLEPCSHYGKTPPCADALIAAGAKRVVMAMRDPFPKVNGGGMKKLLDAGIEVTVGVCEDEAKALDAPYLMRVVNKRPWTIAKWAMTLDGKIASRTGASYWISSDASRQRVHEWRGNVDGILVGSRTAALDDPMLTVRLPEGQKPNRTPARIVFDSAGTLSPNSKLAASIEEAPLILAFGPEATEETRKFWEEKGADVIVLDAPERERRLVMLMERLAERGMTNIIVEGGGELLGRLFDLQLIDEARVFISPKIVGGNEAIVPVGGAGLELMTDAATLKDQKIEVIGPDVLVTGRVVYRA